MNRSMKGTLLVICLVLIVGGALLFYLSTRPKEAVAPSPTATSTELRSTSPAPPLEVTQSGQYYEATLEYPSQTPLRETAGAAADAQAVATMKAYDQNAIGSFVTDADVVAITPQIAEDQGLSQYNKYQLTNTYQLYTSSSTVSYVFTIDENTLGAHPNSYFTSFTFDATSGALLGIGDLFTPGADYLDELSALTRSALAQQEGSTADSSFIDPGTTASSTNFANFALDKNLLLIFFAPYQVAPYAAGPQVVELPLTELSGYVKPEYQ